MNDQNAVATADERQQLAVKIDAALFRGDLSKLSDEERVVHVHNVCRSLGLNPSTSPLSYITLNGRLVLYAKKDATDQLRKLHGIDIVIADRAVQDGLLTVHVRAKDKTGRVDEDYGVVSIAGLRGEAAANAMLKAVTKAKRRVTLSIAGLGFLDESEVDDVGPRAFSDLAAKPQRSAIVGNQIAYGAQAQGDTAATDTDQRKANAPAFDEEEEIEPGELARLDDSAGTWSAWATNLYSMIKRARDLDTIDAWISANSESLATLQNYDTGKYRRLMDMINHQRAARTEADGSR